MWIGDFSTAASAPIAKSNESPGKNGVTTRPVSQKMMAKSAKYSQGPREFPHSTRWVSRWEMTFQKLRMRSKAKAPFAPRYGKPSLQATLPQKGDRKGQKTARFMSR